MRKELAAADIQLKEVIIPRTTGCVCDLDFSASVDHFFNLM